MHIDHNIGGTFLDMLLSPDIFEADGVTIKGDQEAEEIEDAEIIEN